MAVQSKLLPPKRSIRDAISTLTRLYLRHRTRVSRAVYLTFLIALIHRIHNAISEQNAARIHKAQARAHSAAPSDGSGGGAGAGKTPPGKRIELNRDFVRNLVRLLKIVIPGWTSVELRLIFSHSVFLVARTLLSIYVADLDGKLVGSLVRGRAREFLLGLVWWMTVAVPATFTNSMVRRFFPFSLLQGRRLTPCEARVPPMQALTAVPHTPDDVHPQ